MHTHSFKDITEYFADITDEDNPEDEILHVFECSCGFTLIEKRRPLPSSSGEKKTTIYIVLRKSVPEFLQGSTRSTAALQPKKYIVRAAL